MAIKAELLTEVCGFPAPVCGPVTDLREDCCSLHPSHPGSIILAFNELPYLRLRGDYGTGKTRGLLAIGSLCYRPFFASGASTVSPIFHTLDRLGGTLILDEADFRFSDATSEVVKILNNGNVKGMPVLRTMQNRDKEFNPRAFRVFGPKIIAMRGSYDDPALESRFLTEDMGLRPMRADIPISQPTALRAEALRFATAFFISAFAIYLEPSPTRTRSSPVSSRE